MGETDPGLRTVEFREDKQGFVVMCFEPPLQPDEVIDVPQPRMVHNGVELPLHHCGFTQREGGVDLKFLPIVIESASQPPPLNI